MDNRSQLSPYCVDADYKAQAIPQYAGNPLIMALPLDEPDEELLATLALEPVFEPAQRDMPAHQRLQLLKSLHNFMVPMDRHLKLARALDTMMRAGYVGRAPRTPDHARIHQAIYDKQKVGIPFRQAPNTQAAQMSTALIGVSGTGKTTTVMRCVAHIPKVIYHPELNVYQVPYLHVEMPSNGSSIRGLAHGILQQLDRLVPGANYYTDYALRGKPGADTLMASVARLMHMHCVGLLIADEVQNLANAHKGDQTVMTELVSACNTLQVPILFIGTNKADKIFGLDFRHSRRSSGHGMAYWDRFHRSESEDGEWETFIAALWKYQWVKQPIPLNGLLMDTMYECSQGIVDIAIKLFASGQAIAIQDGTEFLSAELIKSVYATELKLLHPMLEALRDDDIEALTRYQDITPLGVDAQIATFERRALRSTSPLHRVTSADPGYATRLVSSLVAVGYGVEESEQAVATTIVEGRPVSLERGQKAALRSLQAPSKRARAKPVEHPPATPDLSHRPRDLRHAIGAARTNGTTIPDELRRLGMLLPLDAILDLT
jgi:hypothetical protein